MLDSFKNTFSLQLFASVSNDAILIIDYKGIIVSANEAANSLLQTDLAKTQLTLFEHLTADSAVDLQEFIETVVSTQLPSTIELEFLNSKTNSVNLSVKGVNYTENKCILLCLTQLESFDSIEEQVHDTFFEYSSIAWMFFDKDGKLAYYNKMAKRFVNIITGLELKKTRHYSEYSVKNQTISLESLFEKAYAGEEIRAERNYTIRSYPLILEFHFRPVKKGTRNSGIILTMRNITKEKTEEQLRLKAEADLKKSDQKYKGLIEHAFDAIYITRGRHFEYVNKRFIEITGYSEEELTDKNFDFSVTLTDKSKKIVEERYQARQRGEELPSRYHFQLRSKTGNINDVEITTVAIQEENDVVVMGIMRDITEQLATRQALENERAYFKHLFESVPFGIVVLDENEHILVNNQMFTEMFGYQSSEIFNRHIDDLIVSEAYREEGKMLTGKVVNGFGIISETKRLKSDGKLLDVAVIGKTIIMPDGRKSVFVIYQDITDRILIRKALEAEKTYFQNLFDGIPFGIVLLHPNGETADCNEGFVHLFQYSKKEIFNKGNIKIIIPDQLRLEGENYRKRVATGEKVYFETQRLRKDGELIDVSITAKPLKRPDGESFVFAIFQDISLRKQAEHALEESELQLSNLITNLPGMVYRCLNDEHYTMLYVSEGSTKVTGYTPEQYTANENSIKFSDIIIPEYNEPIKKIWDECLAQKIPFEFEYQIKTASGEIKWIWERGRGVYDEVGNLMFLEGYIEDINERKKAETALEKERELMQALMDNIPDTIYFKDRESRFIRINYTQARVLGVKKPEDAIGKTDLDFFQAEHADVSLLEEREMMESGISVVNKQEHIFTSNGWRWFTATKVPLYDTEGKVIGMAGISRDITEFKHMEDILRKSENHLLKTNAEKDKLFSVIAHDLRSPFNSFVMLTEMFIDDEFDISFDEMKQLTTGLHKSATSLADLLENLLNWSRIQRGLAHIEPRLINAKDIFDRNLSYFNSQIISKQITVIDHVNENINFHGDDSMMSSAIRNLISNAIKFTPQGGTVTLNAQYIQNKKVQLLFSDTGIGIPESLMHKLFTVELQGRKGTNNEPSSGLGLILVKEFVELNSGTISVESTEGVGTTFIIELPSTITI